jgi:hypothetical protein
MLFGVLALIIYLIAVKVVEMKAKTTFSAKIFAEKEYLRVQSGKLDKR